MNNRAAILNNDGRRYMVYQLLLWAYTAFGQLATRACCSEEWTPLMDGMEARKSCSND
jgi:hypothetical protein